MGRVKVVVAVKPLRKKQHQNKIVCYIYHKSRQHIYIFNWYVDCPLAELMSQPAVCGL